MDTTRRYTINLKAYMIVISITAEQPLPLLEATMVTRLLWNVNRF